MGGIKAPKKQASQNSVPPKVQALEQKLDYLQYKFEQTKNGYEQRIQDQQAFQNALLAKNRDKDRKIQMYELKRTEESVDELKEKLSALQKKFVKTKEVYEEEIGSFAA